MSHFYSYQIAYIRYGGERYEEREMQTRVRERFRTLQAMDENSDSTNCANSSRIPWKIVNAAQSIEQVEAAIWGVVCGTLNGLKGHDGDVPLNAMWQEENYAL